MFRMTKFQIVNATSSPTNLQEDEKMIDETTNVIWKIIPAFTISRPSDIQMSVDSIDAKFKNTLLFVEINLNDETEYQRLKRAEKKTLRAQKMQRFRVRENQNWVFLINLSIRNVNSRQVHDELLNVFYFVAIKTINNETNFKHLKITFQKIIQFSLIFLKNFRTIFDRSFLNAFFNS